MLQSLFKMSFWKTWGLESALQLEGSSSLTNVEIIDEQLFLVPGYVMLSKLIQDI